MRWFLLVVLFGSGCGACAAPGLSHFELRTAINGVTMEFANGDIAMETDVGQLRFSPNLEPSGEALPGLLCRWALPDLDGTEYVRCGNTWRRRPGGAWERVAMPTGEALLGRGEDGTEYFRSAAGGFSARVMGGAVMPVVGVSELFRAASGHFIATTPQGPAVLKAGAVAQQLPTQDFPPAWRGTRNAHDFVDAAGFAYLGAKDGSFDRFDLNTGARDTRWLSVVDARTKLPNLIVLGVSSSGRLFAQTDENRGLSSGQPNNELEFGVVVSLGRGDTDWRQETPPIVSPLYSQPFRAFAGRSGRLWLSACIANCAPGGGSPQTLVKRLDVGGSPTVAPPATRYMVQAGVAFHVPVEPVTGLSSVELTAAAGCRLSRAPSLIVNGLSLTCDAGTHGVQVELKSAAGATLKRLAVEITATPPPSQRRGPRSQTVSELQSVNGLVTAGLWIDAAGQVRFRRGGGGEEVVPGLASARSVVDQVVMTENGSLFSLDLTSTPVKATKLNAPAAVGLSTGFFLGQDKRVYPIKEAPTAITGIDGVASLSCSVTYSDARPPQPAVATTSCQAIASDSQGWSFISRAGLPQPAMPLELAAPLDVEVSEGVGLGRDGTLMEVLAKGDVARVGGEVVDFTTSFRLATASGVGAFYVPVTFVVTRAGEAWALARFKDGVTAAGVETPSGTAATRIESTRSGFLVWLDDGRVGEVEFNTQGNVGAGTGLLWRALDISPRAPGW